MIAFPAEELGCLVLSPGDVVVALRGVFGRPPCVDVDVPSCTARIVGGGSLLRLEIVARRGARGGPTEPELDAVLGGVDEALGLGVPLLLTVDLRELRVPSRAIVRRGTQWAGGSGAAIDAHVRAIAVVVPNVFVKAVVDVVLRATQPPMPTQCFREEEAALRWARQRGELEGGASVTG